MSREKGKGSPVIIDLRAGDNLQTDSPPVKFIKLGAVEGPLLPSQLPRIRVLYCQQLALDAQRQGASFQAHRQ